MFVAAFQSCDAKHVLVQARDTHLDLKWRILLVISYLFLTIPYLSSVNQPEVNEDSRAYWVRGSCHSGGQNSSNPVWDAAVELLVVATDDLEFKISDWDRFGKLGSTAWQPWQQALSGHHGRQAVAKLEALATDCNAYGHPKSYGILVLLDHKRFILMCD